MGTPLDLEPATRPSRCPDNDAGSDIVGCGGADLRWDGEVWDCMDCGLWLEPGAAGVEWEERTNE